MIWFYGSRLYGKVDHVPGLFFVATRFGHLQFIPFVPLQSYLVFDDGTGTRGVELPLQWKSVLTAWLRLLLLGAGVVFGVMALVGLGALGDPRQPDALTRVLVRSASCVAALGALWGSYRLSRAGDVRAVRLAERAGLDVDLVSDFLARRDLSDGAHVPERVAPPEGYASRAPQPALPAPPVREQGPAPGPQDNAHITHETHP